MYKKRIPSHTNCKNIHMYIQICICVSYMRFYAQIELIYILMLLHVVTLCAWKETYSHAHTSIRKTLLSAFVLLCERIKT